MCDFSNQTEKKVKVDDASADGDLEDNDQIGQARNTNFPTYSSYLCSLSVIMTHNIMSHFLWEQTPSSSNDSASSEEKSELI